MITNSLIPSFYTIDVEGDAIGSFFLGDFGIEKITFLSNYFDNDLAATSSLQKSLENIKTLPKIASEKLVEKVDFNPEFFPTLEAIQLTPEQILAAEELEEQLSEHIDPGRVAVAMTFFFDPAGDYVQSRWKINSKELSILGKVCYHPQEYLQKKANIKAETLNSINPTEIATPKVH